MHLQSQRYNVQCNVDASFLHNCQKEVYIFAIVSQLSEVKGICLHCRLIVLILLP